MSENICARILCQRLSRFRQKNTRRARRNRMSLFVYTSSGVLSGRKRCTILLSNWSSDGRVNKNPISKDIVGTNS